VALFNFRIHRHKENPAPIIGDRSGEVIYAFIADDGTVGLITSYEVESKRGSAGAPVPPFGHLLWVFGRVHAATLWNPPFQGATANHPLHSPVKPQWPQLSARFGR
jgi:hypothetical protein